MGENQEEIFMKFKQDPAILSWIGGSVLSRLEGAKEYFVTKTKFLRGRGDALGESYSSHLERIKAEKLQNAKQKDKKKDEEMEISKA